MVQLQLLLVSLAAVASVSAVPANQQRINPNFAPKPGQKFQQQKFGSGANKGKAPAAMWFQPGGVPNKYRPSAGGAASFRGRPGRRPKGGNGNNGAGNAGTGNAGAGNANAGAGNANAGAGNGNQNNAGGNGNNNNAGTGNNNAGNGGSNNAVDGAQDTGIANVVELCTNPDGRTACFMILGDTKGSCFTIPHPIADNVQFFLPPPGGTCSLFDDQDCNAAALAPAQGVVAQNAKLAWSCTAAAAAAPPATTTTTTTTTTTAAATTTTSVAATTTTTSSAAATTTSKANNGGKGNAGKGNAGKGNAGKGNQAGAGKGNAGANTGAAKGNTGTGAAKGNTGANTGAAKGNTGATKGNTGAAKGNTGAAKGNTGASGNTGAAKGNTGATAGKGNQANAGSGTNTAVAGSQNLDFGSCTNPTIQFAQGLPGRNAKEFGFQAVNTQDFPHGAALNIGVITDFVCLQFINKCGLKQDSPTIAACRAAEQAALPLQGGAAADAFNKGLGFETNFAAVGGNGNNNNNGNNGNNGGNNNGNNGGNNGANGQTDSGVANVIEGCTNPDGATHCFQILADTKESCFTLPPPLANNVAFWLPPPGANCVLFTDQDCTSTPTTAFGVINNVKQNSWSCKLNDA